jgi:hypothetical protein
MDETLNRTVDHQDLVEVILGEESHPAATRSRR